MLSSDDEHSAFGNILGYLYNGPNWHSGDRYSIGYDATNGEGECNLYSFNIPISEYNNQIKMKILNQKEAYERILKLYGYSVSIHCWKFVDDEPPEVLKYI